MVIKRICIIGVGEIGYQIMLLLVQRGFEIRAYDINPKALEAAKNKIKVDLEQSMKMRSLPEQVTDPNHNLLFTDDLKIAVDNCDMVIESVPENIELKKQVFKILDDACLISTILVSNSSSLCIGEIGSLTKRQDRIIGMHFTRPTELSFCEIIPGVCTSDSTLDTTKNFARSIGKKYIVIRDSPGQAGRLLLVQINEALKMIAEGICTAEDINIISKTLLGHHVGLMKIAERVPELFEAGLEYMQQKLGDQYAPHPLLKQLGKK